MENKEFLSLLESLSLKQTFQLKLTDDKNHTFCQLTTLQLKELIKTIVDSPITQVAFNNTCTNVMEQCLVSGMDPNINIVDRLLFLIATRIQSLGEETYKAVNQETGEEITVSLADVLKKLQTNIEKSKQLFEPQLVTLNDVTLVYGIPTLLNEKRLNQEVYDNLTIDSDNMDEVRDFLGKTFMHEITKCIKSISTNDTTMEFELYTFDQRSEFIEKLPVGLIKSVITFIEKYKSLIKESLTVNDSQLSVDSSFFAL